MIPITELTELNDDHKQAHVGKWHVSTVSLTHKFMGGGKGYETMVFEAGERGYPSSWMDRFCRRYETWNEALLGHSEICLKLSAGDESDLY